MPTTAPGPDGFGPKTRSSSGNYPASKRRSISGLAARDSRVPANQITGLLPGEMFVHRNVANVVPPADLNCLSALQFAVDVLKVRHVIVCGHYGCAGVRAVLHGHRLGLVDNWLQNVEEVRQKHAAQLAALEDEAQQFDRLCELNVVEQVANVCETTVFRTPGRAANRWPCMGGSTP